MKRELNLRSHQFHNRSHLQQEVEHIIDNFVGRFLHQRNIMLRIIVGKGVNSKNFINGKNPLRYYTEQYLNSLNVPWRNGQHWEGQEGVIIVEL